MARIVSPIYLVGAGPGDPDLLTVKAYRLLREVDVVVYDKLVSPAIMDLIPRGTTRIFAGKQARNHHMPQEDINDLLVDLAIAGRRVLRLKGGDPFVFGRGAEEVMHLAKHQVPFEIVPGITSSTGCTAYAGIPLTHRDLAHSVRFITGHTQDPEGLALNWESLADPDTTLVIYMGLINIHEITARLMAHGLDAETPAAAINQGTRPEQQVLTTTLKWLAKDVSAAQVTGATLLVIGKVVGLADQLAWFPPATISSVQAK